MSVASDPVDERPPSALARAWSGNPGRLLRVALAILPLVWLSRRLDWAEVAARAHDVGVGALAVSLLCLFGSTLVGCVRWRIMLRAYGAQRTPTIGALMRHNMVGAYFNVLPSGVAGDAVRGHRVRAYVDDLATSYTVLFVERLAGLVGLCLIAAGAIVFGVGLPHDAVTVSLELGLVGAMGLSLVVLLLPFAMRRVPALGAFMKKVPVAGAVLAKIPPARSMRGPLAAVALSTLTQGFVVMAISVLIRRLAPHLTLMVCARIVPAIILVTYIPLTPGGLGQREAAFVTLFGRANVPPATAVVASLLFMGVTLVFTAIGGIVLLGERWMIGRGTYPHDPR